MRRFGEECVDVANNASIRRIIRLFREEFAFVTRNVSFEFMSEEGSQYSSSSSGASCCSPTCPSESPVKFRLVRVFSLVCRSLSPADDVTEGGEEETEKEG